MRTYYSINSADAGLECCLPSANGYLVRAESARPGTSMRCDGAHAGSFVEIYSALPQTATRTSPRFYHDLAPP